MLEINVGFSYQELPFASYSLVYYYDFICTLQALDRCQESPPTDWPAAAYVLLGREDLASSHLAHSCKSKELETQSNTNLVSMSTPYMLHLHPVTIPSTASDTIGLENAKFEDSDSTDGSMMDGMEHIFKSSTQLRYGRDLRLNEVCSITLHPTINTVMVQIITFRN